MDTLQHYLGVKTSGQPDPPYQHVSGWVLVVVTVLEIVLQYQWQIDPSLGMLVAFLIIVIVLIPALCSVCYRSYHAVNKVRSLQDYITDLIMQSIR